MEKTSHDDDRDDRDCGDNRSLMDNMKTMKGLQPTNQVKAKDGMISMKKNVNMGTLAKARAVRQKRPMVDNVPNPNVIKAKAEKEILRDELAKVYITSN
jgi:hypothetical protein